MSSRIPLLMKIAIIHWKTNDTADTVLDALEYRGKERDTNRLKLNVWLQLLGLIAKISMYGILIYLLESLLRKSTISFILIFIPHSYSINIYWLSTMYNRNLVGNQSYLVLTWRKDVLKKSQKHGI